GALCQGGRRGHRRSGHRAPRGDEAVQRDQERRDRCGPGDRRGERRAGEDPPGAHRGGTDVNQPRSARITGWGAYAPANVLTNDDLSTIVDTSDEWIASRTGIRERRVAGPSETTATMAATAGMR